MCITCGALLQLCEVLQQGLWVSFPSCTVQSFGVLTAYAILQLRSLSTSLCPHSQLLCQRHFHVLLHPLDTNYAYHDSCQLFEDSCHVSDHSRVEQNLCASASIQQPVASLVTFSLSSLDQIASHPYSPMHCQVTFEPQDCLSLTSVQVVYSELPFTEFELHPPGTPPSCWHTPQTTPSETPPMPASLQSSLPSTRGISITAGRSRKRGTCWGRGLAASWWGMGGTPQPTLWTR